MCNAIVLIYSLVLFGRSGGDDHRSYFIYYLFSLSPFQLDQCVKISCFTSQIIEILSFVHVCTMTDERTDGPSMLYFFCVVTHYFCHINNIIIPIIIRQIYVRVCLVINESITITTTDIIHRGITTASLLNITVFLRIWIACAFAISFSKLFFPLSSVAIIF